MQDLIESIDRMSLNIRNLNKVAFLIERLRSEHYYREPVDSCVLALSLLNKQTSGFNKEEQTLFSTMAEYDAIHMTLEIVSDYLQAAIEEDSSLLQDMRTQKDDSSSPKGKADWREEYDKMAKESNLETFTKEVNSFRKTLTPKQKAMFLEIESCYTEHIKPFGI